MWASFIYQIKNERGVKWKSLPNLQKEKALQGNKILYTKKYYILKN